MQFQLNIKDFNRSMSISNHYSEISSYENTVTIIICSQQEFVLDIYAQQIGAGVCSGNFCVHDALI